MALSSAATVIIFCLVLCTKALEQQPRLVGHRKPTMEERLAQVEAKMEGEVQEKLRTMQDSMQRLEKMMIVMAEVVEAKANPTEDSTASLEATKTESQSSSATCQYKYQYQFEKESSHSFGEQLRIAKLESELTRLQEKVSALDRHLQDNDLNTMAMKSIVHSMTELVSASEQNIKSTMENTTNFLYKSFASMINDMKAQMIGTDEQSTKELGTHLSDMESKLHNATSLLAVELENVRAGCKGAQTRNDDLNNRTTGPNGTQIYRRTCQDYYDHGQRSSGIYALLLETYESPMKVYCDMTFATGWVVFQRRQDGSVNFYRNWTSYENGFGDVSGEFWLGNRNINRLTRAGLTQLRVDLQAWNGFTAFASYSNFSLGDARSSYTLSVAGYSGTAGDDLSYYNGCKFSTYDEDHDASSGNCAEVCKGAWWYSSCTNSNLNGQYGTRDSNGSQYIWWYTWLRTQSLLRTELKLK